MPWNRRGAFDKHTKGLPDRAQEAGRKAANAALKAGKSDVSAIRIGKHVAAKVSRKRGG